MQLSSHIAGLISIVLGLCCSTYLLWTLIRQHRAKRWSSTRGEILESDIEEDADGWSPHVRYAYAVKGKRYTNDRLYFHLSNRSLKRDALKHLSPYAVGKAVTVHYNPREPEDAVLERQMPLWRPLFWLFMSTFLLVVGMVMWRESPTFTDQKLGTVYRPGMGETVPPWNETALIQTGR